MNCLEEGNLRIAVPKGARPCRFDGPGHGLSHCMKAVDFVVEMDDRILFIECKDPDHPESRTKDRKKWLRSFQSGEVTKEIVRKYRDSFLYAWAEERAEKPIHYCVLIAMESLTDADLLARTDELRRSLPVVGPPCGSWKRSIVTDGMVFNLRSWNRCMKAFPATRIIPGKKRALEPRSS